METLKNRSCLPSTRRKRTSVPEQQIARLKQLRNTFTLKRKAAEADLRIGRIRRDRSERARQYAESTPRSWKSARPSRRSSSSSHVQGHGHANCSRATRCPGLSILDVVTRRSCRCCARDSATRRLIHAGQPGKDPLRRVSDLVFDGKVEFITPIAVMSQITPKVRQFVAVISIKGKHERLMPDLSASIDLPTTAVPVKPVAPAPRAPGGRP